MKKSEIHVGQHYAYSARENSARKRVEIVEKDISRREGGTYGRKVTGHLVRDDDGREFIALSRNLRTTWDEEAIAQRLRAESRRRNARAARDGRVARAPRALAADRLLEALGAPLVSEWLPRSGVGDPEEIAAHAAELGLHTYLDDRDRAHFVVHGSSVVEIFVKGGDLVIPARFIDALTEAAEVFL